MTGRAPWFAARRWDHTLTTWGVWWLSVQRVWHPQLGRFWGIKIGPLALYLRWNTPERDESRGRRVKDVVQTEGDGVSEREPWFASPDEKCVCGHRRSLHHLAGVEDGGCLHCSPVLLSPCRCDGFRAANSQPVPRT